MSDYNIHDEMKRFRVALPELQKTLDGRWVVFRLGTVVADFESEESAYSHALEQFGLGGGFIVIRVEEPKPAPLTAAVMFLPIPA